MPYDRFYEYLLRYQVEQMYAFINEVNGKKLNQTNEDIATRLECIEWVSLKLVHFDSFWFIVDSGPFLVHYGPF